MLYDYFELLLISYYITYLCSIVDRAIHRNTTFLRDCETEKLKRIEQRHEYAEAGITIIDISEDFCQPDGYYAPVQRNTSYVYCADQYGRQIENYAVERNDPASKTMNCSKLEIKIYITFKII